MNIQIEVIKLHDDVTLPQRMTPGSAGMDLCAYIKEPIVLHPGRNYLVPTGIAINIQIPSIVALIYGRSGLANKHKVRLGNSTGVVDSDYQKEIFVLLFNDGDAPFNINNGDRIAQLVFTPVYLIDWNVVDEFSTSTERTGGFGSTGITDMPYIVPISDVKLQDVFPKVPGFNVGNVIIGGNSQFGDAGLRPSDMSIRPHNSEPTKDVNGDTLAGRVTQAQLHKLHNNEPPLGLDEIIAIEKQFHDSVGVPKGCLGATNRSDDLLDNLKIQLWAEDVSIGVRVAPVTVSSNPFKLFVKMLEPLTTFIKRPLTIGE